MQLRTMRLAFDIIGGRDRAVAIVELPKGASQKEVATEVMRRHSNVKSVLAKEGPRAGQYRVYKLKLIAGSKQTEVIHQEHGMKLKLDPRTVFFSPREAEERQRIAKLVKPNERVLVMFAGAGPYAIAIAKAQPRARVEAIELNKAAVRYALENVKLNGLGLRVKVHQGDAMDSPKLGLFDRIVMPLPESAWKFLPAAFRACNKGGTIHLYGIAREKALFSALEAKVKQAAKRLKARYKIIGKEKVLPYAPRTWKVRINITIL